MKTDRELIGQAVVSLVLLASAVTFAAAGDFDESFNRVGFTRNFVPDLTRSDGVAIHSSGEIVTLGAYFHGTSIDLILWRHLTDGTLDPSFGGTGVVYPPSPPQFSQSGGTIAIDNQDRIVFVVLTSTSYVVYRLNFDGSLDLSFAGTGFVAIPITLPFPITGLAIQPDNKIVGVGGSLTSFSQFIVYRLNEAGTLDLTFGGTGIVFTQITPGGGTDRATGVAIQADGKIVAAGRARVPGSYYDMALARYLPTGELDPSFGSGGKVVVSVLDDDLGRKVVIQPDGKIAIAGSVCRDLGTGNNYCYVGVARVDEQGALDLDFGGTGKVYTDVGSLGGVAYDVALQSDNKLVLVGFRQFTDDGSVTNTILIRHNSDGSRDGTFGADGISETNYGYSENLSADVRIQSDGQIVTAGATYRWDFSFGTSVTARYVGQSGTRLRSGAGVPAQPGIERATSQTRKAPSTGFARRADR